MFLSPGRRRIPPAVFMAVIPVALFWHDMTPGLKAAALISCGWIAFVLWNSARVARRDGRTLAETERAIDDLREITSEYARRRDEGRNGDRPSPPASTHPTSATPRPAPGKPSALRS